MTQSTNSMSNDTIVLQFLREKKTMFAPKRIALALCMNHSEVRGSLQRLEAKNLVEKVEFGGAIWEQYRVVSG